MSEDIIATPEGWERYGPDDIDSYSFEWRGDDYDKDDRQYVSISSPRVRLLEATGAALAGFDGSQTNIQREIAALKDKLASVAEAQLLNKQAAVIKAKDALRDARQALEAGKTAFVEIRGSLE